jgi:hypothetical protein
VMLVIQQGRKMTELCQRPNVNGSTVIAAFSRTWLIFVRWSLPRLC